MIYPHDLQGRPRRQAISGARPVLSGLVSDPAAPDPARRVGHHDNGLGVGPAAVGGFDVLRRPVPPCGEVERRRLPGGRVASRGARRAAQPGGAACPAVRHGCAAAAEEDVARHTRAPPRVDVVGPRQEGFAMPRLDPVPDRDATLGTKIAYFFTKRRFVRMTGRAPASMLEPLQIYAHIPKLLSGYGRLEQAVAGLDLLDRRHRALAELKAATTPRCEYCIDMGSQIARGWGLTDEELLAALRRHFDTARLVELTHVIALENLRARFNLALGIGAAGFSEGAVCARP